MTYRDPEAFRHCYTVLRPIYDHHLAQVALQHGVALSDRHDRGEPDPRGRPNRRHLHQSWSAVRRPGLPGRGRRLSPGYARGLRTLHRPARIAQVPPGHQAGPRAAARRDRGDASASDPKKGSPTRCCCATAPCAAASVHLNMGGFVYTNRQSLSSAWCCRRTTCDEHFDGDPNLLMEWFENLPCSAAVAARGQARRVRRQDHSRRRGQGYPTFDR